MGIIWSGRIRIDETDISDEQYEAFFRGNMPLDKVNEILACKIEGYIVPADELKPEFTELIEKQILFGHMTEGYVDNGRIAVCWAWTPTVSINGEKVSVWDAPYTAVEQMVSDILKNQQIWGRL